MPHCATGQDVPLPSERRDGYELRVLRFANAQGNAEGPKAARWVPRERPSPAATPMSPSHNERSFGLEYEAGAHPEILRPAHRGQMMGLAARRTLVEGLESTWKSEAARSAPIELRAEESLI